MIKLITIKRLDIKIQDGYQKFSDVRITINGLENIKKYCKTDSLEDIIANKLQPWLDSDI